MTYSGVNADNPIYRH